MADFMPLFAQSDDASPDIFERFHAWLLDRFLTDSQFDQMIAWAIVAAGTILLAFVAHLLAKAIVVGVVSRIARRTRTQWDNFLIERKLFKRLAHLAPAGVIYLCANFFPDEWQTAVQRLGLSYVVLTAIFAAMAILNALVDIYNTLEISKTNPIKGFVGGAKLFVAIIGGVFLISTILGRDPWGLVAGIGAVTAVLLLVFKDSILGLVASIQIITNDLVNVGDWIEMPRYGADGDVLDISLTTIKVQNFDKTITSIPTYAVLTESFKNWRGMQQSGGRRIKRSLSIDMTSVRFLTDETIARFEKFQLLADYIRNRKTEVEQYNAEHSIDTSEVINGRRLTNLGTFRAYVKAYLQNHPKISRSLTFLVRQLPPGEKGLPLEIYVFSTDKNWINYEEIQADIFDHLLAVLAEFDLRVYQNPAAGDYRAIADAVQAGRND